MSTTIAAVDSHSPAPRLSSLLKRTLKYQLGFEEAAQDHPRPPQPISFLSCFPSSELSTLGH